MASGSTAARKKAGTSRKRTSKRSTYHHGNLPAMMEKAVLEVIAETGVASVSIAEAARRAGVSVGAPYRHFKDREELLVSVARSAYDRLWGRVLQAINRQSDPEEQLVALVKESFAAMRDDPAGTELFLNSGFTVAHRELDATSRDAFFKMVEIAGRIAPQASDAQKRDFVMSLVSICYGTSRMKRERFSPVTEADEYEKIGVRGVRLLIRGFREESKRSR